MLNLKPLFSKKLAFLVILIIVVYLSLWQAIYFDFWRDDWGQIWAAIYKPELLLKEWVAIRLHPGSAIQQLFLAKIFGFNSYYWQITGLFLKVVNSLLIGLMFLGITKSKKAAILSSLFYASSPVGLESYVWISANTSALLILFLCPGIYYWVTRQRSKRRLLLAIAFLNLAICVSPGRGIFILCLVFLYELFEFFKKKELKNKLLTKVTPFLILLFTVIINFRLLNASNTFNIGNPFVLIVRTISNAILANNLITSLGGLVIGWVLPIEETGSLLMQRYTVINSFFISLLWLFGFIFLISLSLFLFYFFIKREGRNNSVLFFLIWAIGFFVPNFIFDSHLNPAPSHRYLTISSIGVVCILAYLLKNAGKVKILFAAIIIFAGIINSNRILYEQNKYRSKAIVEGIWNEIDNFIPKGEKDIIFVFTGSDFKRRYILDWSGSVPFGIKRNIKEEDAFPIVVSENELIKKLIYQEGAYRPSIGKWSTQKTLIPISHLFVLSLEGDHVVNLSDQYRRYFENE